MQIVFSLCFFLASLAFTVYGIVTLDILDPLGMPGAGFFPLLIGSLLLITTAMSFFKEFKARTMTVAEVSPEPVSEVVEESGDMQCGKDTAVITGLIVVLLMTFQFLGSFLSMVLFCVLFLSWFNRKKFLFNVLYSLLLPAGVYVLFAVILRAGLPQGILGF